MKEYRRAFIELHIAVFLFGFTAILGEVITLHPVALTWWRVLLTSTIFLAFPRIWRNIVNLSRGDFIRFSIVGVLAGLHWLTFYWAIKASNASITLVCLATTTLFTAFIEPLVMRTQLQKLQILIGVIIIPGMVLVVNSTGVEYHLGIVLGLISAVLSATFGALNKKWLRGKDPITVTFVEILAATLCLSCFLPTMFSSEGLFDFWPDSMDWLYLFVLAALCTNVAYVMALRVLRSLSAYQVALTINLEPIYGVTLAAILLAQHEELNVQFYLGALVILLSVFGYPILVNRLKRKTT